MFFFVSQISHSLHYIQALQNFNQVHDQNQEEDIREAFRVFDNVSIIIMITICVATFFKLILFNVSIIIIIC